MATALRRRLGTSVLCGLLLTAAVACAETEDPSPTGATETTSPDPAQPSGSQDPGGTDSPSPTQTPSESGGGTAVPVYYAGTGDARSRLFREWIDSAGDDPLTVAARAVDGGAPADPDYRTLWPGQTVESATASDGLLVVRLNADAFTEAPDGMPRREARLALQQMVYTLQGTLGERVPVQFVRESGPPRLFGLDVSEPVTQASALKVLNHVNITSPVEGATVSGEAVEVTGAANSFEANVVCRLVAGGEEVALEPFTAEGWMGDRLFPFSGELPLTHAGTGEVLLECSTDDPSGGAEGPGPFTDTKLLQVE